MPPAGCLARLGRVVEAEAKLRRSIELDRTEAGLAHLASVLKQGGRTEEAERIAVELNARLAESVKKDLISRPAKDFQLPDTNGRQYRLSDPKGKVVLVSTWATWCGPCAAEMPLFVEAYEKYRERGLATRPQPTSQAFKVSNGFAFDENGGL
jgi:thiol-disulfide isomerase/thioredoxin